jgi:hypothetical protein
MRSLLTGAAFAVAVAATSLLSSFAAPSAFAGAGDFSIERPDPSYLNYFENPFWAQTPPPQPILGY